MNTLRPDELASLAQIERNKRRDELLKKGMGTALNLGSTALGIGMASKVMPFLNNLIPADLAVKGLSKISPQLGNFLKKGQSMGLNVQQGLQFIKNNLQSQQNPLQEFETNYPDLSQALQAQINQGQSPDAAAAILKTSGQFGGKVKQLEKALGKDFIDYVLELFGQNQTSAQPQSQAASAQQNILQAQPQQANQQQGINPQLLQIMNGIRSAMQNLSGGGS